MENKIEIIEIEIEKIKDHEKNPRLELGDLTELTESIKEKGIMQNLTVIRDDVDSYICIIGHRRKNAAKLAGLKTVPCMVVEMTEKEQIATMIAENMQRSDLTVYEQAKGFQMMMELGDSIKDIMKKTGLSETTVRHRVKLGELDEKTLKETEERGANINDYIELEKIKDLDRKNKVLEKIGTDDFNFELKKAIKDEETQKLLKEVKEIIKDRNIEEIEEFNYSVYYYLSGVSKSFIAKSDIERLISEIAKSDEKIYFTEDNYRITFYILRKNDEETDEEKERRIKEEKKREERERIEKKIKEIMSIAKDNRRQFLIKLSEERVKKNLEIIIRSLFKMFSLDDYLEINENFNIEYFLRNFEISEKEVNVMIEKNPVKSYFIAIFSKIENEKIMNYYSFCYAEYDFKDEYIIYDEYLNLLKTLGYKESEEERKFYNGEHEIFMSENEE